MTLGVVAYKVGGERQCPSKRKKHVSNPYPNLKLRWNLTRRGQQIGWNGTMHKKLHNHTIAQHKPGRTCWRTTADCSRATSTTEHVCTKAVTLFTQGPDHKSTTGSTKVNNCRGQEREPQAKHLRRPANKSTPMSEINRWIAREKLHLAKMGTVNFKERTKPK